MAVIELDNSTFAKSVLGHKGDAVVYFYAEWCSDCKRASPFMDAIAAKEKGVRFFKLDAQKFQGIADKFGVEYYPTIVFFKSGKALGGHVSEPQAQRDIEEWLATKLSANLE
ncbi:MAG TPA: thioredoxin family protein [Candidatus Micrarchaeota archaeon]|nr:thioredoxin family protein [Candidatus Micrarchaeota archaeon]